METMSQIPGFVTVAEAAEIIGVSGSQIYHYIRTKALKPAKVGREYLIPIDDARGFQRPPIGNPMLVKRQ